MPPSTDYGKFILTYDPTALPQTDGTGKIQPHAMVVAGHLRLGIVERGLVDTLII